MSAPAIAIGSSRLATGTRFWTGLALVLSFAVAVRLIFSRGMFPSDDLVYFTRGLQIAHGIWSSSDYIGAIRYGTNIPIGLAIALFGPSLASGALVPLLASILEIVIVALVVRQEWGPKAALYAATILSFIPLHIELATSIHADPILACAITSTFALFWWGERARDAKLYFAAGICAGFMYWVKEASVLIFLVFPIYAAVVWRWSWAWLFAAAGAALMFALNCALMWAVSGDPLHVLRIASKTAETAWTSSAVVDSPSFYLRYLFLDIRNTWISGYAALAGGVLLVLRWSGLTERERQFAIFVAVWLVGILAIYSVLPISFTPLRFVMKQSNYMTVFLAPLAVAGSFAIASFRRNVRILTFVLIAAGGTVAAALGQQDVRSFFANSQSAEAFAAGHPNDLVYATAWVAHTSEFHARLRGLTAEPRIHDLRALRAMSALSTGKRMLVIFDRETNGRSSVDVPLTRPPACWLPDQELVPQGFGIGAVVTRGIADIIDRVPEPLGTRLSQPFKRLLHPAPAEVYSVPPLDPWCGNPPE